MKPEKENRIQIINIIPFLGIAIFIGLYIFSSTLYPGGSQANLNSEGFDWVNNYWCNLMNEKGINGLPNPARPYSILAMIILCISLMTFFIQFAETYSRNRLRRRTIKISGILSMSFAILIFTQYHDLMTIISSVFGFLVIVGVIKEVYNSELTIYKIIGVLCILLLVANNYIYYTLQFIDILPLLQKFTFVMFLIWIVGMNYELNKKKEKLATTLYNKS